MEQLTQKELFEGAQLLHCKTTRFKSTRITVRFALPLRKESVSAFAALPGLLRYTARRYPTTMAMERKLASLYGAGFSGVASKIGDAQILSFTISTVADRFALGGERISEECLRFLLACIFEPDLDENGCFKAENLAREKRLMIEDIQSARSDKMIYAMQQLYALLYAGEGAAIPQSGTPEQVEALSTEAVTKAWKTMLEKAKILVFAVGDTSVEELEQTVKQAFSRVNRSYESPSVLPHPKAAQLKQHHETEPLEQCKLNIGFSVGSEDEDALKVMNMIFGRSEMSKLSKVVREKMSLCYYCSSAYMPHKKTMLVFSGVEVANRGRATEAIMEQLRAMQRGEISQDEIDIAKRKLKDAYLSAGDSPLEIAQWYLPQMLDKSFKTAAECIERTQEVTKERIIACAQSVQADAIYSLGEA